MHIYMYRNMITRMNMNMNMNMNVNMNINMNLTRTIWGELSIITFLGVFVTFNISILTSFVGPVTSKELIVTFFCGGGGYQQILLCDPQPAITFIFKVQL
jgi:hypothetical protein